MHLHKGNFPTRFGGRLSSVIDVIAKEGNRDKLAGAYSLGLVNSQANINGPLSDQVAFSLSGRVANLGLVLLPSKILFDKKQSENYANFFMHDYNAKVQCKIDDRQNVSISTLVGQDKGTFLNQDLDENILYDNRYAWSNGLYSIKYNRSLSPIWYVKASTFLSTYRNNKQSNNSFGQEHYNYLDKSTLREYGMRIDNEFQFSSFLSVDLGVYVSRFSNRSNEVTLNRGDDRSQLLAPGVGSDLKHMALYSSTYIRLGKHVIQPGVRMSRYDGLATFLEPRFTYSYSISNDENLSVSYARLSQPLHLTNGLISDLPISSWIVAQENLPVSTSQNVSISYSNRLSSDKIRLEIGAYYRQLQDLTDFPLGTQFVFNREVTVNELLETGGIGRAYGLEVLLDKKTGKTTGWLSMTFSKSQRRFRNINHFSWYATQYQRDLKLNFHASRKIGRGHTLSSNIVWGSGIPITYPEGFSIAHPDNTFNPASPRIIPIYQNKHNAKTPNYFRIDLQYRKEYKTHRGNTGILALGIYNLSGRLNPLTLDVSPQYIVESADSPSAQIRGKLTKTTVFNFIPFISLGRKF